MSWLTGTWPICIDWGTVCLVMRRWHTHIMAELLIAMTRKKLTTNAYALPWTAKFISRIIGAIGILESGLKPNPGQAMRQYLRIATTYGHPAAQFALGEMNMVGEGVKANPQQALKWLTAAARKRHPGAQAYLGDLYWTGRNVKKSETRALMWYILAMETAQPIENPQIIRRYNELVTIVDGDMRLEAEARARVWTEQFPPERDN